MVKILIAGVILDLILGDPYSFPHPVKWMGHMIMREEILIRKFAHTKKDLQLGGFIMVLINLVLGFGIPFAFDYFLKGMGKTFFSIYGIYVCISGKMLHVEACKVKKALGNSLEAGRKQLSNIVGRDTRELTESEIIKATVETVAENTSDGIIAPLFYILIFGIPGGFMYKFVNTMDSMVGYTNDKYIDLGRFPAIVDDIFNYIPARITALLMIVAGFFYGKGYHAYKIVKRDHKNHLSPNAGYPEGAIAGILGVQLGGGHHYFGKYIDKPRIGDYNRKIEIRDISKTVKVMYITEGLFVILMTIFIHVKYTLF
ncbi:MAG: adenosylcobinamide-phosphate synthase CbiB [Tissierellia bacterium]|nr:adenosylcobinamide-phosphate synthase CbiB [Tissierellia bacterium]